MRWYQAHWKDWWQEGGTLADYLCPITGHFLTDLEYSTNYAREGKEQIKMAKNSSSSGMFAIILIAVVLFFTNPTVDQFADWAVNEATEGATEVESFLGSVLGKPMVKMATERKDYYLFSIYTVSMDRETKVLGLGTKFFVISE